MISARKLCLQGWRQRRHCSAYFLRPLLSRKKLHSSFHFLLRQESNVSKIIAELQMCNGMQPEIEPGDILIIDADSESVKDGDIALLLLDGNRAVRRLKHIDGGVWLIPSNNAFADEFIATEEMGRVCILGKVTERRRKY